MDLRWKSCDQEQKGSKNNQKPAALVPADVGQSIGRFAALFHQEVRQPWGRKASFPRPRCLRRFSPGRWITAAGFSRIAFEMIS